VGAFSKELWIAIAVCVPVIAWTAFIAQERGDILLVPLLQVSVLLVGGIVIWRMGERILEAVTRVWEKIDGTRIWDVPQEKRLAELYETPKSDGGAGPVVFCQYCGYSISAHSTFCRHCGKRQ